MPFIFSFNKKPKIKKNHEEQSAPQLPTVESTFFNSKDLDFHLLNDYKFRFLICLLITIPILILSPTLQEIFNLNLRFSGDTYVLLALTTFIVGYGGWPFFKRALAEIKAFTPSTATLISLAIIIFYVYSVLTALEIFLNDIFWVLALIIVILLLSHWISLLIVNRLADDIQKFANQLPNKTHKLTSDGQTSNIASEKLKIKDRILVNAGEIIPADGVILEGVSTVDSFEVTGTEKKQEKQPLDEVLAGSLNISKTLIISVTNLVTNSYLAEASKVITTLHEQQSTSQKSARNKERILFFFILLASIATLITWIFIGNDISFALERMIAVLLIASPLLIGLTSTIRLTKAAIKAFKKGILIRKRHKFEEARFLHAFGFNDLTPFTEQDYIITNIETYNDYEEDEVIFDMASLLANTNTPFTKGLLNYANGIDIELDPISNTTALPNIGYEGHLDDDNILLCHASYIIDQQLHHDEALLNEWLEEGKIVIFALANGLPIGMIAFNAPLKEDAQKFISDLKDFDLETLLLTSLPEKSATATAEQLNINKVFASLSPQAKVEKLKYLQQHEKLEIGIVGNGLNDAELLHEANLGVAINAGNDMSMEESDISLVENEPNNLVDIVRLSITKQAKASQLVWIILAFSIIAVLLATGILNTFGFLLSPLIATIVATISSILFLLLSKSFK